MKTYQKSTILLLTLQMIFAPLELAWAQSAPSTKSNPRLAVVEVYDGKVKPQKVEQVAESLREALTRLTSLKPLSPQEVNQFIHSNPDLLKKKQDDPYTRYYLEARELFNSFEFVKSIALLEKTIASYRAAPTTQAKPFNLTDAYLFLGYVQLSNKNERQATQSFQEAIRLNPREDISESDYPPNVTDAYRKLRSKYLEDQKGFTMDFQSNAPETTIFLNGKPQGKAPLRLDLTSGEHFLVAVADGYQPWAQRLNVNKPEVQKLTLKAEAKTSVNDQGLNFSQLQDTASQVQVASNLAEAMKLDKVVLVSLEERGWNYKITARMIDPKYRASYKQKSIEVVDLDFNTPTAVSVLAKDLEQINQIDIAKDPERYADGEVAVLGRKRKKSLIKSPLLWSLVGAAVVGGTAAGILATRGGSDDGTFTGFNGPTQALKK